MAMNDLVNEVADLIDSAIVGFVGQKDKIFMKVTYYIDPEEAQRIQSGMTKVDGMTDAPWFSDEDFDNLAKVAKKDNNSCDVCLYAQQGTTYFKYCYDVYKQPLPVVTVEFYRDNDGDSYTDNDIMKTMNTRWGGQFRSRSNAALLRDKSTMKNHQQYASQYEYKEHHNEAIVGQVGDIQEKTPLINNRRASKGSNACYIMHVFAILILLLLAAIFIIIQWRIASSQLSPAASSVDPKTLLLMAEDTSVLLANYSIRKHQHGGIVTITEMVLEEDYFHVNKFVAVPSAMIRIHHVPANDSDLVIPLSDNAIALNERYVYVLEGSVFNYIVCGGEGAMATKSTFYAFDNEDDYNDYLSSDSLTTVRSIFSKVIEVGGKNAIKCTTFNFTVNRTSYYFFALKTRYANTRINYSLSASFNQLSFSDYIYNYSTCSIVDSDHSSCIIQIPRYGQWSIIGYSQKNYDFNSHLNHVQLSMDSGQSKVYSILQPVLLYTGITLAGVCLLYTVLVMVVCCVRKRQVSVIIVYN